MSRFLWQSGRIDVDQTLMEFTAGEDVQLDRVLLPFDIQATAAHVRGLGRIGVLSEADVPRICDLLDELLAEFESGSFVLDDRFEDGHSAIEFWLTKQAGELGGRVHAGRSRNDQVAVATRLYMKDRLAGLMRLCHSIGLACLQQAEAYERTPMPGYTHLQRAVPSSIGLWMGGFAEAFADNIMVAGNASAVIDSSPLGTAAGYGVNLPLDREFVAQALGFPRLQLNPQYAQNSRGKFEILALQAAGHAMQDLRRLAWDLSLYTTAEFDFLRLPDRYTTGSSIMPNKRNPDVVELLRGRVSSIEAAIAEIQGLLSLPSGYQRDLQLTKGPLIRGMEAALQALAIVPELVAGLEFNEATMAAAISRDMYATDIALEKAASGMPFRDAYREAKSALDDIPDLEPGDSLANRVSPGACADLRLDELRRRLEREFDVGPDSSRID